MLINCPTNCCLSRMMTKPFMKNGLKAGTSPSVSWGDPWDSKLREEHDSQKPDHQARSTFSGSVCDPLWCWSYQRVWRCSSPNDEHHPPTWRMGRQSQDTCDLGWPWIQADEQRAKEKPWPIVWLCLDTQEHICAVVCTRPFQSAPVCAPNVEPVGLVEDWWLGQLVHLCSKDRHESWRVSVTVWPVQASKGFTVDWQNDLVPMATAKEWLCGTI